MLWGFRLTAIPPFLCTTRHVSAVTCLTLKRCELFPCAMPRSAAMPEEARGIDVPFLVHRMNTTLQNVSRPDCIHLPRRKRGDCREAQRIYLTDKELVFIRGKLTQKEVQMVLRSGVVDQFKECCGRFLMSFIFIKFAPTSAVLDLEVCI